MLYGYSFHLHPKLSSVKFTDDGNAVPLLILTKKSGKKILISSKKALFTLPRFIFTLVNKFDIFRSNPSPPPPKKNLDSDLRHSGLDL